MLLIHGSGLAEARFTLKGTDVRIARAEHSANGHWAFLFLETTHAAAQSVLITAESHGATVSKSYELAERKKTSTGHAGFSAEDVLYEIMPDRYSRVGAPADDLDRSKPRAWHGGNLAGITAHVGQIKALGATALWLTPVMSNAGMNESYHGYAATDFYSIDSHFGTVADYQKLSDALHAEGIKLIIDLAPNHLGVEHVWINDPPAPEWFHGTREKHLAMGDDFNQLVDPHAAPASNNAITRGWFTDAMPDLNQSNPLVERYLIDNTIWWIEKANLDGLRLDTFPYVDRVFWQHFNAAVHAAYPKLTDVGEIFHRDPIVTSYFAGGVEHNGVDTGLDTPFDFPVYFTLRDVLAHDKSFTALKDTMRADALYPHPERLITFIGNHDTTRFITEAGGSLTKLEMAQAMALTMRGMPMIYSGDEIAMSGGEDPDNRHDFPGGFAGDKHNAFTADGRTADEQKMWTLTSSLTHLRAQNVALREGVEQNLVATDDTFAFVRAMNAQGCKTSDAAAHYFVAVNKAKTARPLTLSTTMTALEGCSSYRAVASSVENAAGAELKDGSLQINLAPESFTLFEVR